jgi:tetratricopeptide (TPR) repeat protein
MSAPVRHAMVALLVCSAAACAPSKQTQAAADVEVIRAETAPERLQARGDAAAGGGDLTRAEQYFVAALRAGGDERVLTKRLLIVCATDGRYPAAANYGEDYVRKHPRDTDVRYALATVYLALGNLDRARRELEQVVEEKPDVAEAHYALATVLRQEGDALVEADGHFREYIRLDPEGPYAEAARSLLLKSVP